jgi:hypothetical protein
MCLQSTIYGISVAVVSRSCHAPTFSLKWSMKMAVYGLQATPGYVAFTGYTNTLGTGPANTSATSGQVLSIGITQTDARLMKTFRRGAGTAAAIQLLYTLLGAATGGTATKTKKQVQGVVGGAGGMTPIETITLVNRATTAADLTAFQALLTRTPFPASYVADLSGNGGGGKVAVPGGGSF